MEELLVLQNPYSNCLINQSQHLWEHLKEIAWEKLHFHI